MTCNDWLGSGSMNHSCFRSRAVGSGSGAPPAGAPREAARAAELGSPPAGCQRRCLEPPAALHRRQDSGCDPCPVIQVSSRSKACGLTVKDRPAVLGGGGQRQAGGVELVPVVPDADLKLDGIVHVLQHGRRIEGGEEGVLAPPEVLLRAESGQGCQDEDAQGRVGSRVWQALATASTRRLLAGPTRGK